jgi:preprotein translocase subunit SecG
VLFAEVKWYVGPLTVTLILLSLFMILLVLIQRGKGGGLAGAFGGAGGSSAFGSRAGDTFTRVTIISAAIWLLLIMILIKSVHPGPPSDKVVTGPAVPAHNLPPGGDFPDQGDNP